jgi:hypothetical protein
MAIEWKSDERVDSLRCDVRKKKASFDDLNLALPVTRPKRPRENVGSIWFIYLLYWAREERKC